MNVNDKHLNDFDLCIAIPTFGRAKIIKRFLDTLLPAVEKCAQSTNFRVVVCVSDNASEDETVEVLRGCAAQNPNLRFISQDRNLGATENFLRACLMANSRLYWLMGDDDHINLNLLEGLFTYLSGVHFDFILLGAVHDVSSAIQGEVSARELFKEHSFESIGHITRMIFSRRLVDNSKSKFRTRPEFCLYPQFFWLVEAVEIGGKLAVYEHAVVQQVSFGSRSHWKLRHIVGRFLEFPLYIRGFLGCGVNIASPKGYDYEQNIYRDFLKYLLISPFVNSRWREIKAELRMSSGLSGWFCVCIGSVFQSKLGQFLIACVMRRNLRRLGLDVNILHNVST